MGMFHLLVTTLALFMWTHFGEAYAPASLSFWIDFLQRDRGKLWNTSDPVHVKDFNACLDFFRVILDGYILATLSQIGGFKSVSDMGNALPTMSASTLQQHVDSLVALVREPRETYYVSSNLRGEQAVNLPNMIVLLKHGLLLMTFHSAMRIRDTGLMINGMKFISVWFQASKNHKYAAECLKLTACLNGVYSKQLAKFWMENALANLSGKREGFMALDAWNEHIVKEVKGMIPDNLTSVTSAHARNICSLLIMNFRDIRQRVSEELDANIFDHHSSRVSPWRDSAAVANRLLSDKIAEREVAAEARSEVLVSSERNLYSNGLAALANGEGIWKLKKRWISSGDYDVKDDDSDCDLSDWSRVESESESDQEE
jgi:hypothetical protein